MLERIPHRMYFDNDADFYKFAVVPQIVPNQRTCKDGSKIMSMDFNFSKEYQDAVDNNIMFIIQDDRSNIRKNGVVSYRSITKPVCNLGEYRTW